ncbi:reverse transcriptase domain-containing protein [Tanacetum coccineum]
MRHGFDLGYKTWVHHGEPALPPPPPVIDNTRQPQMSDMTALLNDLSYIPLNNEHNEPTQGDIGCCRVILTTYNLPPWLCMKESSFMLTLLIPGPKSPGKDIDVYLRPLIEDLKVLWDRKGVETIDVASGQKFNMRAMVLWTINDFPARSSLSGWSGQGYKACPTCNKDTPSVRVLSKTAYVGHRRFLKKPHKWRSSREFNGQTDNRDPPKEFGRDEILAQLDRLPTRLTGKHPSYGGVKIKTQCFVECNWTKTPPRQDKTCKGWAFEVALVARQPKREVHELGLRILFTQRTEIVLFSSSKELNYQMGSDHASSTNYLYPPALFDIMIHLVIHLPLEALEGGPIRPPWMFPFERYMKKLKGYVRNKAKPEGSIAEGYVAEEALTFSSHYFRDVTTKFNRPTVMWIPLPQRVSFRCSDRPEIDTYRSQFKSLFPNKDMKEEFPEWFGSQSVNFSVNLTKTQKVSTTREVVMRFVDGCGHAVHSRDDSSHTQNSGICSPGPDEEMYYGQLQEILEFKVDAPPDIIDVVDQDDDITDDEDALPHDLADSDDEDLINDDDDGVDKVYSSEEED